MRILMLSISLLQLSFDKAIRRIAVTNRETKRSGKINEYISDR